MLKINLRGFTIPNFFFLFVFKNFFSFGSAYTTKSRFDIPEIGRKHTRHPKLSLKRLLQSGFFVCRRPPFRNLRIMCVVCMQENCLLIAFLPLQTIRRKKVKTKINFCCRKVKRKRKIVLVEHELIINSLFMGARQSKGQRNM